MKSFGHACVCLYVFTNGSTEERKDIHARFNLSIASGDCIVQAVGALNSLVVFATSSWIPSSLLPGSFAATWVGRLDCIFLPISLFGWVL